MADRYLGTIVATTTPQDNLSTGTPFAIPTSGRLLLQPDADCYHRFGNPTDLPSALTTANGVKVLTDAAYMTSAPAAGIGAAVVTVSSVAQRTARLAVIASTGTVNMKVFERQGNEGSQGGTT